MSIRSDADYTYRTFVTDNVPSSGKNDPDKALIRALFYKIDTALSDLGINGAITVKKSTKAALDADLAHVADTLAIVWNDATAANNGIYAKSGGSGAGSWAITDIALPSTFADDIIALTDRLDAAEIAYAEASDFYGMFTRVEQNFYSSLRGTADARLDASGDEEFESGGFLTRFLPVNPSTTYTIVKFTDDGMGVDGGRPTQAAGATSARIHTYEADGTLVQAITTPDDSFTTGASETQVRLSSILYSQRNLYMLVEGTTVPKIYTPYEQYHSNGQFTSYPRMFEGLKGACLFDSLGVDADSWWKWVFPALGLTNSPFDDNIDPFGGTDDYAKLAITGSSYARHENYGIESGRDVDLLYFHRRVQYIPTDRSVIFVGTGTNERSTFQNPGGTSTPITVGNLDTEWAAYLADPNTVNDQTTYGGVIMTLHKIIERLPNAAIFGIGAPPRQNMFDDSAAQLGGLTLEEHNDNIERVYKRFGIPFYHPFKRNTGLRPWETDNFNENFEDPTHLSSNGHGLWGPDILAWVLSHGPGGVPQS